MHHRPAHVRAKALLDGQLMLTAIAPKDIGQVWEKVRAGLVEVQAATTSDWLPEDVYMSLKQANSVLFIGQDDAGEYQGFLVLRVVHTFHSTNLEIWCAHSASSTPLMRLYFPQIQDIARGAAADKITFLSTRPEWEAVGKRMGFTPGQTIYEFTL